MNNRTYKVTIYDNNRIKIQYNRYNPFEERASLYIPTERVHHYDMPYMTTKQYKRTLRKKRKELFEYKLDPNKCIFLTLTTTQSCLWTEILGKFKVFMRTLRRNFKDVKYIRTIESFGAEQYFHIHTIIIFDKEIPKTFNKDWIKKHWEGIFDFQNVVDPYALTEYFTLFKEQNILQENEYYTKYPEYVKIITNSRNLPISYKKEFEIDKKDLPKFYQKFEDNFKSKYNKEPYCFSDGHYYIDQDTGEFNYDLDKEFIH